MWFAADAPPADDKLVFLDGEHGPVLNAAIMSNVAPGYAPAGKAVVVAALPGVCDGELEQLARTTLRRWWGSQVDGWETVAMHRIRHGQPAQLPPFAPKRRVALGEGLFVCGDHRDTASIQGALFSGRRCAHQVAVALGAPDPAARRNPSP